MTHLALAALLLGPPAANTLVLKTGSTVTDLAFTTDGRGLLTVDTGGTVVRWDLVSGKGARAARLGPYSVRAAASFGVTGLAGTTGAAACGAAARGRTGLGGGGGGRKGLKKKLKKPPCRGCCARSASTGASEPGR